MAAPTPFDSPIYKAGVEQDDLIVSIDGVEATQASILDTVLARHKPGEMIGIRLVRRSGERVDGIITLEEDPRVEIVTVESTGLSLSPEQKRFRDSWLNAQ